MKRILSFVAVLFMFTAVTGCDKSNRYSTSETSVDNAASESVTNNTAPDSASDTDTSNTFLTTTNNKLTRSELESVLSVFEELAYLDHGLHPDLDHSGCCCDYVPECVDMSDFFTEEIEVSGGLRKFTYSYYRVASGDYSTESGFNDKLDAIFTENCKRQYLELMKDNYRFKDNKTYITDLSYLSYEPVSFRIEIAVERSNEKIVITLTNNNDNSVDVPLVADEDGKYRIDGLDDVMSISWWFSFNNDLELVYGDDIIKRPSAWDTAISSEIPKLWSLTRFEQCLSMLNDYANIDYLFRVRLDTSDSVTEEWEEQPFYKVVDTPLIDEKLFYQKLSLIFTEKAKEQYTSTANRNFTFKDGCLYMTKHASQKLSANDGHLTVDSVEYPDDDTILMTFTALYEPPDRKCEYKVKFVKENGTFYKIDEIDRSNAEISFAECLWFYSEVEYGDISVSLKRTDTN